MNLFRGRCKSEYVARAVTTGFAFAAHEPVGTSGIIRCKFRSGHRGLHAQQFLSQVVYTWTDDEALEGAVS